VSVQYGASRAKAFTQKARVNATRRKFTSPARAHCSTTVCSGLRLRRPGLCIRRWVRLGRYEELAKRAICNEDPGGPEDFSVAIMAVKYPRGIVNFAPAISRIDQVNYYKFYLGSFCVYMKFDRRPFVSAAREFVLKDEGFAHILLRDFAENEFFAVGKIGRGVKPVK
ncbi:hypothetical protein, partial [Burkholderia ubonensis]|uniref:hypothetical protein n=1 Tax=Burkholderia ubonensis TaxID=101571 RepID=UPI001E2FDA62